jgi:hypothetical protein
MMKETDASEHTKIAMTATTNETVPGTMTAKIVHIRLRDRGRSQEAGADHHTDQNIAEPIMDKRPRIEIHLRDLN